jgi:hypothetical protein
MSRHGDNENEKAGNKAGKASSSPPKDTGIGAAKAGGKASSAVTEVRIEAVEAILERAGTGLDEDEIDLIRRAFETLWKITQELDAKRVSIKRLRRMLFGRKTESFRVLFPKETRKDSVSTKGTEAAVPPNGGEADAKDGDPTEDATESIGTGRDGVAAPPRGEEAEKAEAKGTREGSPGEEAAEARTDNDAGAGKEKRKGHGRLSWSKYIGAIRTKIPHDTLSHGDLCPNCHDGQSKVYRLREPRRFIRVTGELPFQARIWELERLRCKTCRKVFTAAKPEGIGKNKYDKSVAAMIALLRYGCGFPFNRIEKLQKNQKVPLPAGTQWGLVEELFYRLKPIHSEFIRQAAQGDLLHNDDTRMKILKFFKKPTAKPEEHTVSESRTETQETAPKPESESDQPAEDKPSAQVTDDGASAATPVDGKPAKREIPESRTGTFTSGIVSIKGEIQIALYFTGRQYAGENLADILARRAAELGPPIHMSDALDQNLPPGFKTIWANCMSHARRKYVDVAEDFPEECRFILETFKDVYRFDDEAREAKMSPEERLAWHQANSKPLMDALLKWCKQQFEEKTIEPNSELGKAIRYMIKPGRWERLTLFLSLPGAPLDNNICERALKKAILHRKNSLFYKTEHGAEVGDLFMSLIHTCELNGADPYDYLLTLLQHEEDLPIHPERWMPWNYKDRLAELPAATAPT